MLGISSGGASSHIVAGLPAGQGRSGPCGPGTGRPHPRRGGAGTPGGGPPPLLGPLRGPGLWGLFWALLAAGLARWGLWGARGAFSRGLPARWSPPGPGAGGPTLLFGLWAGFSLVFWG